MDDSFPFLLNLPDKALMKVLRNMERPSQLGFSILSKRAMNLVKSLNLKATCVQIIISNKITLTLFVGIFNTIELNFQEPTRELILLDKVHLQYNNIRMGLFNRNNGQGYELNRPEYGLSDWIQHVSNVFNCSEGVDLSFLNGCNRYDIQSIYNIFKECTCINMLLPLSSEYSQSILNTFNSVKQIRLSKISSNDRFHDIFIRNFDLLIFQFPLFQQLPKIGLDDLLTMNSVVIEFYESRLSDKILNSFIKHWINGSNPRMETLIIEYPHVIMDADLAINEMNEEELDDEDVDAPVGAENANIDFRLLNDGEAAIQNVDVGLLMDQVLNRGPQEADVEAAFLEIANIDVDLLIGEVADEDDVEDDEDDEDFPGQEIRNPRFLNENVIFNGIDYQIIPREHRRTFKPSIKSCRIFPQTFRGGYDIQRKDGTTATILIKNRRNNFEPRLEMFVWN